MEITRKLDVTAEEFFEQVERSILADIKEATGKDVGRSKLNGFKYKKRARGGGKQGTPMDVKVKRYRFPEVYEVRFSYTTGANTMVYEVVSSDDDTVTIRYEEELEERGKRGGILGSLNRKVYDQRLRHRARQGLKAIEEMAIRERRAHENNPMLSELDDE